MKMMLFVAAIVVTVPGAASQNRNERGSTQLS